jgi:Uma2 family endonuclease
MVSGTKLLTLEEFLALPEEKPYLELIDGEVVQKPVGKNDHAIAQTNLVIFLGLYARERGGTAAVESGVKFPLASRPNFRVPDVSYYLPGKELDPTVPYPDYPPDLAAEVRSDTQSLRELRARLEFLREQGTRWTLLVDPKAKTVEVNDGLRTWTASGDDIITLDGLEGFSFRAGDLFA